jgi:hypothetical protein
MLAARELRERNTKLVKRYAPDSRFCLLHKLLHFPADPLAAVRRVHSCLRADFRFRRAHYLAGVCSARWGWRFRSS